MKAKDMVTDENAHLVEEFLNMVNAGMFLFWNSNFPVSILFVAFGEKQKHEWKANFDGLDCNWHFDLTTLLFSSSWDTNIEILY